MESIENNQNYSSEFNLDNCKLQIKQNDTIKGLYQIEDFITKDEESEIIKNLENGEWELITKRRTMQFGVYYNLCKKWIEQKCIPYPEYLQFLYEKLKQENILCFNENEANTLFNEYLPGQVLYPHIDQFGEIVIGINFLADCYMNFELPKSNIKEKIFLKRRSLYIMTGDARYQWKHGILEINKRRISLTIRSTKINEIKYPDVEIKQANAENKK